MGRPSEGESNGYLRIGEVAAFFGVTAKALRVYEKMGILMPDKVDGQTGYRYYSAGQVKQLDALLELKALGFTLSEIKLLVGKGVSGETYVKMLRDKRLIWQDRVSYAENRIDEIDDAIQKIASSEPAFKMGSLTDEERARLLSKMVCVEDLHGNSVLSEALWL